RSITLCDRFDDAGTSAGVKWTRSRRLVVRGAAVVAIGALSACGSGTGATGTPDAGGGTGGVATGGAGGAAGGTGTGGALSTGGHAGAGTGGLGGGAAGGGNGGATATGGQAGTGGAGGQAATGGTGGAAAATCNTAGAATSKTPTIWVIGDSTASVYTSDLYPRMGWAQPLQAYYAPACATVEDKALSGRSSKSFYDEGDWTPIKAALRAGDTVIIQFGHNDEKADDPTRYTDPFTTYEQYLTDYIDDTLAKGATPILATSINRNDWSNGMLEDTHGNYPVAMRQLAAAKDVALVDATALTKTYFQRLGQTGTTALFMDLAPGQFPNYPDGNTDDTHLQDKGAHAIAQLLLADMYRQGFPIAHLLEAVPQSP
ncbi:MAG TPA: rhamnogalacturonan acetylesterase, partial [Polyangia bacterium]|nr:rhamnogalacturonan acetylesterase [Polyangia bacterium]